MAYKFEVGCVYHSYDTGLDPVKIIRRTEKTIWVMNPYDKQKWQMRIKMDEKGNEYATDSKSPRKWRLEFTYKAEYKTEWDSEE